MLITLYIISAGLVLALLAIILIRSTRTNARHRAPADGARRRAILDDCGDDVVWEVGKLRRLVAPKEFEEQLSKRAFLKRVAFTVSAFSVAWLASRGKSVAFGSESRTGEDPGLGNGRARRKDPHQDSSDHTDDHSDGFAPVGDPGHSDTHSDSPGGHIDSGG